MILRDGRIEFGGITLLKKTYIQCLTESECLLYYVVHVIV